MSNSEEHYLYLVNKLMQGKISDAEWDMLMDLAKDDPEKLHLINYLTSTVNETDLIEAEIVYEKTKPNDLISQGTTPLAEHSKKLTPLVKILIAAASLIVVFFSCFYYYQSHKEIPEDWQYITTKRGERKFLTLKDGTEVWLNNESELKILKGYGDKHRTMALKGEGYFSVSKNPNLPLIIHTKDTDVKVIGTIFNVSSYPESRMTTTSLIEGKVALKILGGNNTKEIIMQPGDQVKISKVDIQKAGSNGNLKDLQLSQALSYRKVDLKDEKIEDMMWVENHLVFNNNTLAEIALKLERWYNKEIVIQNDKLLSLSYSGTFQERECTQVLDILKKAGLNIHYHVKNNTIYIN